MKIFITYDSSWRNSFLDGNNNEKLPKRGRKFIGSMTNLKKPENFIPRKVTLDTVMGVLNRLIGDQKKLYQSRSEDYGAYFFKDIEPLVKFTDYPVITNEMTYIRNITGSTDQNSYTGMIKTNDIVFFSDYSIEFWGVLALDLDELCRFIVHNEKVTKSWDIDPLAISARFIELAKEKVIENDGRVSEVLQVLEKSFPGTNYLNKNGKVVPVNLYCSSLYLQFERLSKLFDTSSLISERGTISGISKRIFTKKDFMNRFTTGAKKKIWGNPYKREEFVKGEGKVVHLMTKASGQLEVEISVEREKAQEIKIMIERAGVSSFYLGKKGLAYVSKIRI
jgi:hypothetical protein